MSGFEEFQKIPRLFRDIVITEKIDGTNGQIWIEEFSFVEGKPNAPLVSINGIDYLLRAGSRKRWVQPENDNAGFARWAHEHAQELADELGPGRHYGEWWGAGIGRRYGMTEKVFSLFNTKRWAGAPLKLCRVVPELYSGPFSETAVRLAMEGLRGGGSVAAPGFMRPEGVVVYHTAGNVLFKATLENDESPKGKG